MDGLALSLQVANHVLQKLYEFDFDRRLLLADLGANFLHHVINAPLAAHTGGEKVKQSAGRLEFHQNVAAIGLGHSSRAEFRAGAPRTAFDFGNRLDDLLHVQHHAVGLGERAARRRPEVEREVAFIHLRQQVVSRKSITNIRAGDEQHAKPRQPHRFLECAPQPLLMKLDDLAETAANRSFFRGQQSLEGLTLGGILRLRAMPANEVTAQRGRPGQRESQRCK